MLRVTVTLLLASLALVTGNAEYCYADISNPYLQFGTKTAYDRVYDRGGIPAVGGCQAERLWLLSRHGTRYPSWKTLQLLSGLSYTRDLVLANYEVGQTSLCARDAENLRSWRLPVSAQQANTLTTQGKYDLFNMARRLSARFPTLLNKPYTTDQFVFRHTKAVRTKQSADFFAKGMFGTNFSRPLSHSAEDDHILYGYKTCSAWSAEGWDGEVRRWDGGPQVAGVVANVRRRLGLPVLPPANVSAIYDMCRYQSAWQLDQLSPWCAVFTEDDLKVLEYRDDLETYYGTGPGNHYARRLSCLVLHDLLTAMSQPGPPVSLYFSHDSLLSMVISRLGLEPTGLPPTADNYDQQQYRQYRASRYLPFATNVMAVLYNCSGVRRVSVYHAERTVRLTGCDDTMCDVDYFKLWLEQGLAANDSSCSDYSFCWATSAADAYHVSVTLTLSYIVLVCGTSIK